MKISSKQSRLEKWYFTFFVIIVICFASVSFIYTLNNEWDNFYFGVELLNEEMYEELIRFRYSHNISDSDSIQWTDELLDNFKKNVAQEFIDETIDSKLADYGFTRLRNVISGRVIYQSPDLNEKGIKFVEKNKDKWGFVPITFKHNIETFSGIGYWGERINTHYFVATLGTSQVIQDKAVQQKNILDIAHDVSRSVQRNALDLYVTNTKELSERLKAKKLWAYVYLIEKDSVLWQSESIHKTDLFLPTQLLDKYYYLEINDIQNNKLVQYTSIHDKNTKYNYVIDVAVPTHSVIKSIWKSGVVIFLGALVIILITWFGGKFITKRVLRPVEEIIYLVNDITSKNLDIRLPVVESDDEISRLVMTVNDLLDRLSKAFHLQKAFIADASHELRTPLSILMGEIEQALKEITNDKVVKKRLNETTQEIEQMAKIIDDLQWLARSDSGQIVAEKEKIRLDEIVMNTLSRCQILAAKNDIKLNIEKINVIEYVGDEELLTRALVNLVNNAIKFSDPNGIVRLSLFKNFHNIVINVKDNGIGIPQDVQNKIFDRFYRVDVSRSRATGGSGLGLSITQWIVSLHGGKITVDSKPLEYSTFSIYLPA